MKRSSAIYLFLVLLTLAAYWQVIGSGFTNYDDDIYVTANPHVQAGLTKSGIVWAFTATPTGNWHPITWLSHMLDCSLYGLKPMGHHLTSLLFHLINVLLLFLVLNQATHSIWRSAFVAALFAVHPLHVESVAWISERKDVLNTFLWLLTMLAYIHYSASPSIKRYLLIILPFILGLMSKPMLVTLPLMLLLLDYWPIKRTGAVGGESVPDSVAIRYGSYKRRSLRRMSIVGGESVPDSVAVRYGSYKRRSLRRMSIVGGVSDPDSLSPTDSAPTNRRIRSLHSSFIIHNSALLLLPLSAAAGVVAIIAQRSSESVQSFEVFPLGIRVANAFVAYVEYLYKMIWPRDLAVFYPHPGNTFPTVLVAFSVLFFAAISAIVIRLRGRYPYLLFGWLWYVITLVPVIGIVQVGEQAMADRYTYIPLIGIFIAIIWFAGDKLASTKIPHIALAAASLAIIGALTMQTCKQVGYWHDSISLFSHAAVCTSRNFVAENNLGSALVNAGRRDEALPHFLKALDINPDDPNSNVNFAVELAIKGRYNEAIEHCKTALRTRPNYPDGHFNLAGVYVLQGQLDQAIVEYHRTLRLNPDHIEARKCLAKVLAMKNSIRRAPANARDAGAHNNTGNQLMAQGKLEEAIAEYRMALKIKPTNAIARCNLGIALARSGQIDSAIKEFRAALELRPDLGSAHYGLGVALLSQGRRAEAKPEFLKALAWAQSTNRPDMIRRTREKLDSLQNDH